jgi:cyclic pyranopterin phosphate synthase
MSAPVLDRFDRPLRDLRISVTDKCNFRCPYCMPADVYGEDYQFAPKASVLTYEEIERLARLFVRAGVEKIRLTGGEPLVRRDIARLIARLAAIAGLKDLTMTTNGWFLAEMAAELKRAGLHRVTVSVDSLDEAVFARMNGRGYGVKRVLEGIDAALAAGLHPVKVNCVVKRGENEEGIVALARYFRPKGVIVRYIEYMDVGNLNRWKREDVVPSQKVVERINAVFPLEPAKPNYRGEVAGRYRYKDGGGEIGVISSITQPFCGDCTRARLSTDGQFITCLFADKGESLRDPLRAGAGDEELLERIRAVWRARVDRYSEQREFLHQLKTRKIEMYQIGG